VHEAQAPLAETRASAAERFSETFGSPTSVVVCDDLLSTVKRKLMQLASLSLMAAPASSMHDAAGSLRGGILECMSALDHLRGMLAPGVDRYRRLEFEMFNTRAALARARTELVGLQAAEERARHRSLHDGLTSLPNGNFFRQRLDQALVCAEPLQQELAIFYIDLDGFKPLNDALGHEAGDQLLSIVGARLARAVRAEDMASRMGGDEFACLLVGSAGRVQLRCLADKLFDSISAPVKIGSLELSVRPSIGIAIFPGDGTTGSALLKSADSAMYRAKRQQTRHAFFGARDVLPSGGASPNGGAPQ
jgi:diguanylate cyclase (GGDEF)-like protein